MDISLFMVLNISKQFKKFGGTSSVKCKSANLIRIIVLSGPTDGTASRTVIPLQVIKPNFSGTTIHSDIHECQLKLKHSAKRKPFDVNHVQKRRRLLWARRHLGWTITQRKRVLCSDKLGLFLDEMDAVCSRPKTTRTNQTVTSHQSKSQGMSR